MGEIRCPITEKFTTSCDRCFLFKGHLGEGGISCAAKKGQKYSMAARPGSGEYWDTYVLSPEGIKDAEASHSIGLKIIKARGGS